MYELTKNELEYILDLIECEKDSDMNKIDLNHSNDKMRNNLIIKLTRENPDYENES
jgi:hypothetical protein